MTETNQPEPEYFYCAVAHYGMVSTSNTTNIDRRASPLNTGEGGTC